MLFKALFALLEEGLMMKTDLVYFVGKRSIHQQAQNGLTVDWRVGSSLQ